MAKKITIEQIKIEAPYELPDGWKWDFAKNLADIYTGNSINETVKQEKYFGQTQGLNFIGTKDVDFDGTINYENGVKINDYENFKTAPANTPLLCIEGGSAGRKLGFSEEEICFGNKLCAFVCNGINPKLVYYYLQSDFFYHCFMKERHGLIGGVSVNTLKQIPFPVPPINSQLSIVNSIETMFAKLDQAQEKAQSVLDSFETRKAAILHKAFTGKLTANWRKENGVSDDSWEEKTLQDVCIKEITDGTHKTPTYVDEDTGVPFISGKDVSNEIIDWSDLRYIPNELHNELYERLAPQIDDILLSKNGARLGKAAIVETDLVFDIYVTLALLRPNKETVLPRYLWRIINSPVIQSQIQEHLTGIGMPNLHLRDIKVMTIKLPSLPEQQEIVLILDTVLEKESRAKEAAQTVLDQIALLKKSILARAFRGEL